MPFMRRSSSGKFSNQAKNRRLENARSGKAQRLGKQVLIESFSCTEACPLSEEYIYPQTVLLSIY